MLNIEYNDFTQWIQQDDILSVKSWLIDGKNVTWLKTGYGITLWPKVNKQFLSQYPLTALYIEWLSTWALNRGFAWDTNGNIYRLDKWDNAPVFTANDLSNPTFIKYTKILKFWDNYVFFRTKDWTTYIDSATTSIENATPDFSSYSYWLWVGASIQTIDNPATVILWDFLYVASGKWDITRFTTNFIAVNYSFMDDYCVWLTTQWATIKTYSISWEVYFWDWNSVSYVSSLKYPFRISSVSQSGQFDIIVSEDWDTYISSGYEVQKLLDSQSSLRLEDNSSYQEKLNFTKTLYAWNNLQTWDWFLYLISNKDSTPWIYKYGKLLEWLPSWMHKVVTNNHLFQNLTQINSLYDYTTNLKRMYFSWTSATWYWLDYFSFKNTNSNKDWYFVTQVFRWPPNKVNKIKEIRMTTSYVGWNNYIKLYKRINNGVWVEIRDTRNTNNSDTIYRDKINNSSEEFLDIQFKVELHNDLQTDTPPILHWLELVYTINKE